MKSGAGVPPGGLIAGFPFDVAAGAGVGAGEWGFAGDHAADGFAEVAAVGGFTAARAGVVELACVEEISGGIEEEEVGGAGSAVCEGDGLVGIDEVGEVPAVL